MVLFRLTGFALVCRGRRGRSIHLWRCPSTHCKGKLEVIVLPNHTVNWTASTTLRVPAASYLSRWAS